MIKHNHSLRGYCSHGPFAYDAMDEADMKNCGITRKFCYYIDGNTYKVPLLPGADSHFKVRHGGVTYGAVNLDPQVTVTLTFDNGDTHCAGISTNIALNSAITVLARPDSDDDWEYFANMGAESYTGTYDPKQWIGGRDVFLVRIVRDAVKRYNRLQINSWVIQGATFQTEGGLINRLGMGYIRLRVENIIIGSSGPAIIDSHILTSGSNEFEKGVAIPLLGANEYKYYVYYNDGITEERQIGYASIKLAEMAFLPGGIFNFYVEFYDTIGGGEELVSTSFSTPDREDGVTQNITLTIPHVLA